MSLYWVVVYGQFAQLLLILNCESGQLLHTEPLIFASRLCLRLPPETWTSAWVAGKPGGCSTVNPAPLPHSSHLTFQRQFSCPLFAPPSDHLFSPAAETENNHIFPWNRPSFETVVYLEWLFYHRSSVTFLMFGHLNAKRLNQFFTSKLWVMRAVWKCRCFSTSAIESLQFCPYGESWGGGCSECSSIHTTVGHNGRK